MEILDLNLKKVVQVYQTNPFEDSQGGGVRYIKNLLSGIKNDFSDILFIGVGAKHKKKDNIELLPITKHVSGYIKFLFLLILKLPFIDLSKYNIVHVHRLYFAIPFILLKPKLKIVCTLHGRTFSVFESNHSSLKLNLIKPFFKMVERFSIKNIDYLVPVSQDVINNFNNKYSDFEDNKIEIIGSMLDLNQFYIFDSDYLQAKYGVKNRYILFIGRLSDVKDLDFLIGLWSARFQNKNNIKLVVAGSGESEDQILGLISQVCKINAPILLGEVGPKNIPKLISSSTITILSSKHEASPTVVKESLSCGIAMITNQIGDVDKYIVNGKNGYIVKKDYDSYFSAINNLLDNPLSKEQVLMNSEVQLEKCSISYVANEYNNIYRKVLND